MRKTSIAVQVEGTEKILAWVLFFLLACFVTLAHAEMPGKPAEQKNPPPASVPAVPQSGDENAAASKDRPGTSTDFLALEDPLSKPEPASDVALLSSESCKETEGSVTCERTYSNGHRASVITQKMAEGDELRTESVTTEYDRANAFVSRKTVRQRTDYNYYNGIKGTEKELTDIVYETAGKKTRRDLIIRHYHLETGKIRSLTWAEYEQIGESDKAALVYHASLRYEKEGTPLSGLAERWDHGEKTDVYMDWNSLKQGRVGFDKDVWSGWEAWIQSIPLQAYLP